MTTALYLSLYLMTLSQLQTLNWKTAMAVVLAILIAYLMAMRIYRTSSAAASESEAMAVVPDGAFVARARELGSGGVIGAGLHGRSRAGSSDSGARFRRPWSGQEPPWQRGA
ncbi:MAG: hypothetical protein AAGL66_12985 [Pseudomonadota bacterium]